MRPIVLALCLSCVCLTACGDSDVTATSDFNAPGPNAVVRQDTDDFVLFHPQDLDAQTEWPAVIWFNGASGYTEQNNYNELLESIASWGFVVLGGKSMGPNPAESDQRVELLRRNQLGGDLLFQRIAEDKIAVAGHSLGGLNATLMSEPYQVVVAIQGAVPVQSANAIPVLYMTAVMDAVVDPMGVLGSFNEGTPPAWFANHRTAIHSDPRTDGGPYRSPTIAFLRWHLRGDADAGQWFDGTECVLCTDGDWIYETRE